MQCTRLLTTLLLCTLLVSACSFGSAPPDELAPETGTTPQTNANTQHAPQCWTWLKHLSGQAASST